MILTQSKVSRIEIIKPDHDAKFHGPPYTQVLIITETGEVITIMAQAATNGTEVVVK